MTLSVVLSGLEEYTTHRCCVAVLTERGDTASACRNATTSQASKEGGITDTDKFFLYTKTPLSDPYLFK